MLCMSGPEYCTYSAQIVPCPTRQRSSLLGSIAYYASSQVPLAAVRSHLGQRAGLFVKCVDPVPIALDASVFYLVAMDSLGSSLPAAVVSTVMARSRTGRSRRSRRGERGSSCFCHMALQSWGGPSGKCEGESCSRHECGTDLPRPG